MTNPGEKFMRALVPRLTVISIPKVRLKNAHLRAFVYNQPNLGSAEAGTVPRSVEDRNLRSPAGFVATVSRCGRRGLADRVSHRDSLGHGGPDLCPVP
jgi:hypothetical protein